MKNVPTFCSYFNERSVYEFSFISKSSKLYFCQRSQQETIELYHVEPGKRTTIIFNIILTRSGNQCYCRIPYLGWWYVKPCTILVAWFWTFSNLSDQCAGMSLNNLLQKSMWMDETVHHYICWSFCQTLTNSHLS